MTETGFQLEDAIEILERRRWWIILGALAGLALGAGLCAVLSPKYESYTTILVENQEIPTSYVQSTVTQSGTSRVNTLQQRVTSHPSLNALIEKIGPTRMDPSGQLTREEMMNEIRANLSVTVLNEFQRNVAPVFQITYVSFDAELAAEIAREIASLFIAENIKDRTQQAATTAAFLDRELDRLRDEVVAQEEQMRAFQSEHMGSLPTQLESNLRSLDRLNLELSANLDAQVAVSQRVALLRQQNDVGVPGSLPVTGAPGIAGALRVARESLVKAQGIYTDEHPNVQHLRSEVARLERELVTARASDAPDVAVTDPQALALLQQIAAEQMELEGRKQREKRIRAELEQLQARIDQTPHGEQELQTLTRDYDDLTATYHTLLAKKYEAAIARNLELDQKGQRFKLLRPALVPSDPYWPDPAKLLPGGVGVALLLVVLGIGIAEFRNPAFRSVNRITRVLGIPVFASIPEIDNDAIFETPPSGDVDPKLVVYTAPESSPAEQYRGILPVVLEAKGCQVILVTSAQTGDGKTLTCMNLAICLATDLNKRVLVIDGDLRRPSTHRLVRISRKSGLSDVLMSGVRFEECAVNSKIPNLAVLPAGSSIRNPLALITSDAFLALIDHARKSYDLVFIDSPPLLPVVDTQILRKMADMLVFVVRADATPRAAVVRSLKDMRDVAGVVFNSVSPGSFRRYYYHDAYSRYAYGDDPNLSDEESLRG